MLKQVTLQCACMSHCVSLKWLAINYGDQVQPSMLLASVISSQGHYTSEVQSNKYMQLSLPSCINQRNNDKILHMNKKEGV